MTLGPYRLFTTANRRLNVSVLWAWYDGWIGYYWDAANWTLYLCPIPWLVLRFDTKWDGRELLRALQNSPFEDADFEEPQP